jgi:hypothetical protein
MKKMGFMFSLEMCLQMGYRCGFFYFIRLPAAGRSWTGGGG